MKESLKEEMNNKLREMKDDVSYTDQNIDSMSDINEREDE